MLTACAPASECELGENADGTCALFEYRLVMPRPLTLNLNTRGQGANVALCYEPARFAFGSFVDPDYSVCGAEDEFRVFFTDENNRLEGEYANVGRGLDWDPEGLGMIPVVLEDGSLLIAGQATAPHPYEEDARPSSLYQHLTLIDRNGETRWQKLIGWAHEMRWAAFDLPERGEIVVAGVNDRYYGQNGYPNYLGDSPETGIDLLDNTFTITRYRASDGERLSVAHLTGTDFLRMYSGRRDILEISLDYLDDEEPQISVNGVARSLPREETSTGVYLQLDWDFNTLWDAEHFDPSHVPNKADAWVMTVDSQLRFQNGRLMASMEPGERIGQFIAEEDGAYVFTAEERIATRRIPNVAAGSLEGRDAFSVTYLPRILAGSENDWTGYTQETLESFSDQGYRWLLVRSNEDGEVMAQDICTHHYLEDTFAYGEQFRCLHMGLVFEATPEFSPLLEGMPQDDTVHPMLFDLRFRR